MSFDPTDAFTTGTSNCCGARIYEGGTCADCKEPCEAEEDDPLTCPDCGEPLKPKKSWGGLLACYCKFGGRKPSAAQIERACDEEDKETAWSDLGRELQRMGEEETPNEFTA